MSYIQSRGPSPLRTVGALVLLGSLLAVAPRLASAAHGTWSRTGPPAGEIATLAIDPADPGVLYAGNLGVFKSTDGGAHWMDSSAGLSPGLNVFAIAVRPDQPDVVFLAGETSRFSGVFRSIDGGAHWETSVEQDSATALVIDPADPDTMYAGGDPVYKTVDGGATWHPLAAVLTTCSPGHRPREHARAVRGDAGSVFKTVGGGGSWADVRPLPEGVPGPWPSTRRTRPPSTPSPSTGTSSEHRRRSEWEQLDVPGSLWSRGDRALGPPRVYATTSAGLAVRDDGEVGGTAHGGAPAGA